MTETQSAVIGTFLTFPEKLAEFSHAIDESWFTGNHRKAYRYLLTNDGGDCASISSACDIPISETIAWMDTEFSSAFLPQHLENLEKEATLRKIRFLSTQLSKIDSPEEAQNLIDRFQVSLSSQDKTEPIHIKDALGPFSKQLEERFKRNGSILGATTGLIDLDEKTEGLHTTDLVIIAGPPSMGKTSLAMGIAESVAFAGRGGVLIFSFEMSRNQLLSRSAAFYSKVPHSRIRSGRLQSGDWEKLNQAFEVLKDADLYVDDPSGLSLSKLVTKIRRYAKKGVRYVFVDYLQIMDYDKMNENQEIATITRGLKNIAKELDICVVLLSQLNRGSQKEKRKPAMSDLRGSGMIESDADVILFPWREAANCEKCQERITDGTHDWISHEAKAEIIIGKQRQGERNISIPVAWCGEQTRFYSLSQREEPAEVPL